MADGDHADAFCWTGEPTPAVAAAPMPLGAAVPAVVKARRSPRRWLTAAAVIVAGGVAAALVLSGAGGGSQTVLARAADITSHEPGYRFTMAVEASGAGQRIAMSAAGALDVQPPSGSISLTVGGETVNERIVPPYAYLQSPSSGGTWLRIALGELGAAGSTAGLDVSHTIAFLRSVGTVSAAGSATIDGVATTHYHAVIDVDRIAAALPFAQGSPDASDVAALSTALPGGGLPLDVWIDAQDRVRRITMSAALQTGSGTMTLALSMHLYDYGAQPPVGAPPADQVADQGSSSGLLGNG